MMVEKMLDKPIQKFELQYDNSVLAALKDAHTNNSLTLGQYNEKLSQLMQKMFNYKYALLTANGFSALQLSIEVLLRDKNKKCNVLIPEVSTCLAIYYAVQASGHNVLFAPINNQDSNFDLNQLKKIVNNRNIDLIISPNHFGIKSQVDEMVQLGIPVIEDCAQSVFSCYRNNQSKADIQIYSFYPTKGIDAIDGGAVLFNKKSLKKLFENKIYYGGQDKILDYNCYNYKLSNINAYLIYLGLKNIKKRVKRLQSIEARYDQVIKKYDIVYKLNLKNGEVFSRYILMFKSLKNKNQFILRMKKIGIEVGREFMKVSNQSLAKASQQILSNNVALPYHSHISKKELSYIIKSITTVLEEIANED